MRTVAGVCMGMSAMGISPPTNQKSCDKKEEGTAKIFQRTTVTVKNLEPVKQILYPLFAFGLYKI